MIFRVVVVQLLSSVWLCDPMNCSMPGFPVVHYLPRFAQTHVLWVSDAIHHLILYYLLFLLLSIFPSIRFFSSESALHIRWPKYWSFSISPSNEYSGLISFRIDSCHLLAVQGILRSLLLRIQKHQFFNAQPKIGQGRMRNADFCLLQEDSPLTEAGVRRSSVFLAVTDE